MAHSAPYKIERWCVRPRKPLLQHGLARSRTPCPPPPMANTQHAKPRLGSSNHPPAAPSLAMPHPTSDGCLLTPTCLPVAQGTSLRVLTPRSSSLSRLNRWSALPSDPQQSGCVRMRMYGVPRSRHLLLSGAGCCAPGLRFGPVSGQFQPLCVGAA